MAPATNQHLGRLIDRLADEGIITLDTRQTTLAKPEPQPINLLDARSFPLLANRTGIRERVETLTLDGRLPLLHVGRRACYRWDDVLDLMPDWAREMYAPMGTRKDASPAFDVVAELQRQQSLIEDARRDAESRGESTPASGDSGYEPWARRMLVKAGETHIIRRGEKVPLHTVPVEAWPSGLPELFVPPTTVAELLDAAADLVDDNGLHQGEFWTEAQFGVPMYRQRASGHAALHLAAGFNPSLRYKQQFVPPRLVAETEEWLAQYLMVRGEPAQYGPDLFLDSDAIIEGYEQDPAMTGPELVEMWRDCADYVRAGGAR